MSSREVSEAHGYERASFRTEGLGASYPVSVLPVEIDIPVAQSATVSTVNNVLLTAKKIGYPVISRSALTPVSQSILMNYRTCMSNLNNP